MDQEENLNNILKDINDKLDNLNCPKKKEPWYEKAYIMSIVGFIMSIVVIWVGIEIRLANLQSDNGTSKEDIATLIQDVKEIKANQNKKTSQDEFNKLDDTIKKQLDDLASDVRNNMITIGKLEERLNSLRVYNDIDTMKDYLQEKYNINIASL